METELVNEDIHFRELDKEIRAIQNKCAADGMLKSGNYLYMICDLLMRDAERYIEKAYDQFINVIKSRNLYQSASPSAFSISIEGNIKKIHQKYISILEHEMSRAGVLSDSPRKAAIEKELAFSDKFEDKVKVLCAKCDALFAEYTQQKANEEARMLIEKASLEKAEEANAIAKSSKITSWIFGIISNLIALGALIVAYFAYKK